MSKISKYYKVVQPIPQAKVVQDSEDLTGGNLYAAYSWYQRLVQGSSTRQTRYREYDTMDEDVDVAIALDTIAEEMTGLNDTTGLPFKLDVYEDVKSPSPEFVHTLNIALRHWSKIHSWQSRLFPIARNLIKYGDCFFKRKGKTKKWEHFHPRHVLAAVVDKDDVTKVIGWQLRTDFKEAKGSPFVGSVQYGQEYETQFLTADEVIRFSTNDDMSDMAPFGESVLRAVYRSHKQKILLEDSIIIYRVTRAPERRVFKIDVGKMPPMRVKQYLEQIKNDMKQKKIPSRAGDGNQVESVYNPHSAQEDFFFAQRADGKGSTVETLPGGNNLGELADLEYFEHKVSRGLRIPESYWARKTSKEKPIFNDGRVGQAYIEELRFSKYIQRLQSHVEEIMDLEFKKFLRDLNLNVDESSFTLRLCEPLNFSKYRQQELDNARLNTLSNASSYEVLSKRFILERYLQLSKEEIAQNERLLAQEKGINIENDPDYVGKLYNTSGGEYTGDFGSISGSSTPMASDNSSDLAGGDLGEESDAGFN